MPEQKRPYVPVEAELHHDGRIALTALTPDGDGCKVLLTSEQALALRAELLSLVTDAALAGKGSSDMSAPP